MTIETWVRDRAFLAPLAQLRARVDTAIAAADVSPAPIPDWTGYRADFLEGVPLLHSVNAAPDLDGAGRAIVAVVGALAGERCDGSFHDDVRALAFELADHGDAAGRIVDWLLGDDAWMPSRPGALRYVGWLVMAEALTPLVVAFAAARDDDSWLRRYCPTCGSLPAMAQLVGVDPGRRRLLACGCCGSRWRFTRTTCPFCDVESHRLASVGLDGEGGLRIDYCESCRGYLKTYAGEGDERILLADWTSLHLDLAARDRGLLRKAGSLYDLDEDSAPS